MTYQDGVGDEDTLYEAEDERLQPQDALGAAKPETRNSIDIVMNYIMCSNMQHASTSQFTCPNMKIIFFF